MMGVFGALISAVQLVLVERQQLTQAAWSWEAHPPPLSLHLVLLNPPPWSRMIPCLHAPGNISSGVAGHAMEYGSLLLTSLPLQVT